jgi:hypothetical protein
VAIQVSHKILKNALAMMAVILTCTIALPAAAPAQAAPPVEFSHGQSSTGAVAIKNAPAAVPPMNLDSLLTPRMPVFAPDKSKNKWLDGAMQSAMSQNCFTGFVGPSSSEFVGYWGNENVTSPRVGDVYYGRAVVAGVGSPCAGPMANIEIILPPDTFFAIDATNPVRCSVGNIEDWKFTDLPTKECQQKPYKGRFGWVFNRASGEPWDIRDGKIVIVAFPMVSMKKMNGIATNSYLTGAIQAMDGLLDPWDNPKMGVFVADVLPSVTYPKPSATEVTSTTAKTTAQVLNHYIAGQVIFEIGPTTKYGLKGEPAIIKPDANGYNAYQNWTGLKPNTTYHWRARFITADGHSFTGPDQTFKTKSK